MALTRTVIGVYSKLNAGTAAFATEEFTPPANSLLVVRVYAMRKEGSSTMGTPTISGGSLTYTHRSGATTQLTPAWSTTAAWFTAPVGGSPAKMAITVDEASNLNVYEYVVSVIAYTGYNVSSPIGGILGSGTTNIGDGVESRELSEAPASGDETLLCIDADATKGPPKPTLESGWSLVHEKSASAESGIAIASRTGSTSKTVKVADSYAVSGGSFTKAGMGALVIKVGEEKAEPVDLAANITGEGAATGTLTAAAVLSGSAQGAGVVAGQLTAVANLSGSLSGEGTLSGVLTGVANLSASASGTGALSGELALVANLAAGLSGTGSLAAELSAVASLAAELVGKGELSAELVEVVNLAGALAGTGTIGGELRAIAVLAAELGGVGVLEGTLELTPDFFVRIPAHATVDPYSARASVEAFAAGATVEAFGAVAVIDAMSASAEVDVRGAAVVVDDLGSGADVIERVGTTAELV